VIQLIPSARGGPFLTGGPPPFFSGDPRRRLSHLTDRDE